MFVAFCTGKHTHIYIYTNDILYCNYIYMYNHVCNHLCNYVCNYVVPHFWFCSPPGTWCFVSLTVTAGIFPEPRGLSILDSMWCGITVIHAVDLIDHNRTCIMLPNLVWHISSESKVVTCTISKVRTGPSLMGCTSASCALAAWPLAHPTGQRLRFWKGTVTP